MDADICMKEVSEMGTVIVLVILAAIVGGIIYSMIKDRKKPGGGCSGCGGNCGSCSGHCTR